MKHIYFISYSGEYPTLCDGILHLLINDVHWFFGDPERIDDVFDFEERKIAMADDTQWSNKFWSSGGQVIRYEELDDGYVTYGDWKVDMNLLPDYLKFYAKEIKEVMNENIEHGCCGGCLWNTGLADK